MHPLSLHYWRGDTNISPLEGKITHKTVHADTETAKDNEPGGRENSSQSS
jgi:hypothetical protein